MKVAVLPIYFNDAPRVTTHTRADIEGYFAKAKAYYQVQSGGREQLNYHVYDWFMVPLDGAAADALEFNAGDTIVPLFPAGNDFPLSGFEHFVLLIDKVNSHSGAWRPGDPSHRYLHLSAQDLDPALLTHELGHLAGADHGYLQTPFRDIQYGDTFCIMGGEDVKFTYRDVALGNSGPGMAASMLHVCGWLNYAGPFAVNLGLGAQAEARVELAPMSGAPAAGAPARPVLAWSDAVAGDRRLLIEFRVRSGYDQGIPANGSGPGWAVAHLTAGNGLATTSSLVGSIGANAGARLEVPAASVSIQVQSADANHVTLKVTRRISRLFAGDDGVLYVISDTGDLFWYRHDGRGDGTFRWADTAGHQVASGWNFKHVFSGGNGVIYAINDANDLLWFRHDGRSDGTFRWADLNARKVGVGWDFPHVFAGGDGVIYAINDANDLLWFRHDGRSDGTFRWADANPRKVGAGWDPRRIFPGGDGVIYTINDADDLLWFRHDGHGDGTFRWADTNPRKVGTGWSPKHVFAGADGVIYTINDTDDLLWYRHDGHEDGTFRWTDTNPRKVGVGWHFAPATDPGTTVIYAIDADNKLVWFRHDGHEDGTFRWRFDQARVVGAGWDMQHIFSGDNSVLYSIDAAGVLQWYRHDGQVNGSFNWTSAPTRPDGTVQNSGIGWNVKHVFSGGDGVIYAINADNDLLWYRHVGHRDGTFRWTDNVGRKVGDGWDVKHVFSGGDGVIYAINADNDLLWYRHVGHRDGTFRWTDNVGRKVGDGWDVKHVFSGGDGVIYAINSDNDLLWYRHEGRRDGTFRWTDNKGRRIGIGWNFPQVFGG